jgi:hypothetical protein
MDAERLEEYWQAITIIEAQEVLVQLRVMDFPNMKQEARRKTHKEFHALAYPRTHDTSQRLSTEQLAARIKGALRVK